MKLIDKLLLAGLAVFATACNDDFLEVDPVDRYSDAAVWSDEALTNAYVSNIYLGQQWGFHTVMLSSLCDESMENWRWNSHEVVASSLTSSFQGILTPNFWIIAFHNISWNNLYKNIRYCNNYLSHMDEEGAVVNDQMVGEVHYLRAYFYLWLLRQWGGVPIITMAYDTGDDMLVARNTFAETVDFIVEDLDKAIALLPIDGDKTRATKGAAMALKARTLLYAASDQANRTSEWAPGYSNPELIGYTDSNRQERWRKALEANKAVIDLGIYHLVGEEGFATPEEARDNYINMFLTNSNSEDIMLVYYDYINYGGDWQCPAVGKFNTPNGYHGWGGNSPIEQLVEDFEMADGTAFDWNNPDSKAHPFANREPRFYADVLYDGARWRQRPDDVVNRDPEGIVQTGYYQQADGSYSPGIDTRGGVDDWNGTYTGYYMRKFIDPAIDHQFGFQNYPWREMRYAEILLNYAECCIELGQDQEARTYINMIRKRAGMPDVTESGDALRQRYRHERRIEMAWEQQRYFDIRRWMIAPQAMTDAKGIDIRYAVGKTTDPTYSISTIEERAWDNKAYLMPIYLDEMQKNELLIQNPGY